MKLVIEVDLGPLLVPFTEAEQKTILNMVFGVLHDGYMDLRTELDNDGDLMSVYVESSAFVFASREHIWAAVAATRKVEELLEQQFHEEANKRDA